jgi:hypothetical protein
MEAISEFRKADDLENSYYSAENIPSGFDWHHQHNSICFRLLTSTWANEDCRAVDEAGLRDFRLTPDAIRKKEWRDSCSGGARKKRSRRAHMIDGKYPTTRVTGHLCRQVLLSMNRMAEAKEELTEAEKQMQDAPRVMLGYWDSTSVKPELEALQAEILLRVGKTEEGRNMFKAVQRKLRALLGPDAWSQALFRLESIAQVAREAADWELAEYTAKQMLEHDAAYAGSHYAMALVAEHKGDRSVAETEFAKAEDFGGNADGEL